MIAALALFAGPLSPPTPQQHPGVVSADDYPKAALDRGELGPVYIQFLINPDGRVDSCTVLLSSGYKDLDDATCQLVTTRARFSPAQNESGKAIYGTYRQVINWRIGIFPPSGPPSAPIPGPDFDLTINQAPEGVKLPLRFQVQYLVEPTGTRSHCEYSTDAKPAPQVRPPPVIVNLACDAVMRSPIQLVRNHKNEPVEASDAATVRFSVKP